MVVLDTCALIYDALKPEKLSKAARRAINKGGKNKDLICSDISLWEIAMLVSKKRLDPGTDYLTFIKAALAARSIQVHKISPAIADLSVSLPVGISSDPADRIILATTILNNAVLVTADKNLRQSDVARTVW